MLLIQTIVSSVPDGDKGLFSGLRNFLKWVGYEVFVLIQVQTENQTRP